MVGWVEDIDPFEEFAMVLLRLFERKGFRPMSSTVDI